MKHPRAKILILMSAILLTSLCYKIYRSQSESLVIEYPVVTIDNEDNLPKKTLPLASPSESPAIIISETGAMYLSKNPYWWLNSGGTAAVSGNTIYTIQGDLPPTNRWANTYMRTNPGETDSGQHPQNIFRLVSKMKYRNAVQEVKFTIKKYNTSADSHRTASNGVLFFHHYQDGNNLYYAGLRVDGTGVIKKKIKGNYYTMAQSEFTDSSLYNRDNNPILLPMNKMIGLKTVIQNIDNNTVNIKLYVDLDNNSEWLLLAEASDDGTKYGGRAITNQGYVGIRSDFMDAEFIEYESKSL